MAWLAKRTTSRFAAEGMASASRSDGVTAPAGSARCPRAWLGSPHHARVGALTVVLSLWAHCSLAPLNGCPCRSSPRDRGSCRDVTIPSQSRRTRVVAALRNRELQARDAFRLPPNDTIGSARRSGDALVSWGQVGPEGPRGGARTEEEGPPNEPARQTHDPEADRRHRGGWPRRDGPRRTGGER